MALDRGVAAREVDSRQLTFDVHPARCAREREHDNVDAARRAIARGQKIFNTAPIVITGVAGLNNQTFPSGVTVPDPFTGTCTTCHDTPNAGDHSVKALLNIGLTDVSRRTADMPLYTLRRLSTGETTQTTDPGRAMVTRKWEDVGKFKGPICVVEGNPSEKGPLYPPGLQWYWRADFVKELSDEAIERHAQHGAELPTLHSTMHLYAIDGAAHRVGKTETAFSYRDANWAEVIVGVDPDPANSDRITRWCKEYFDALHPYSAGGAYVNFMMDEGQERVQASFRDNYARLALIKNKYDPTNVFRVNQNIRPAPAAV